MGKQKQQVISRFFAPKPKSPPSNPSPSSPPPPRNPSPNVKTTVSFSPSKRKLLSAHLASTPKRPKTTLSPHTRNPVPPQSNPSLHQKFLQKLLEPSSPPLLEHSIEPSESDHKKYTPLEQQVVDLKNKYPDVLLMVEVGYRFRFFGKDAEIAAEVLGIYAHIDRNFLTASVPTFRLNVHVRRLVSAGYKVGVVKQTETAAIKAHGSNKVGPFGRGLSALYTKATLEAAEDVGGKEEGCGAESNYLVCVVEKVLGLSGSVSNLGGAQVRIGIVGVEISTGDVVYGEFNDGVMRSGLEAVVLSLTPAELLLVQPLSKPTEKLLLAYAGPASNVRLEHVSCDCFKDGGAREYVMSVYEKMVEDNLADRLTAQGNSHSSIQGVMNMPDLALQALALTIRHLKQFGFERILCFGASFRSLSSSMEMNLSANALQQLEILRNNSDGSESGSLLGIMNHTLTTYGSRLLRHWITHPLCDRNMISARLDAVSEIALSMGSYKDSQRIVEIEGEDSDVATMQPELSCLISSVLTFLGRSLDIQRGITRIFHRTATPTEFIAVIQAILSAGKQLKQFHIDEKYEDHGCRKVGVPTVQSTLLKRLILTASSSNVLGNAAKLLSTLNKEAADKGDFTELIIISKDQFPEVTRARKALQLAKEKLDNLIGLYRKQFGNPNLEFTCVAGTTHLVELPIDAKAPSNWIRVNSTKKTIRYHPPEVLTALDQLRLANEELTIICRAAWDSFLGEFGEYYVDFHGAVQALAALDCLHSLAILSRNKNYVRPIFVEDSKPVQIKIHSGRHPVLESILQDSFVPNDTILHADREYCQIVTGPNMGGKSCYIRQVALIAFMAQVGSFVPAESATLPVLDAIYTRMGASDSIQQGRSTFLEELSEASQILRNCTSKSLVIIDELGRGTSTHDGVAIAYATLHHLLDQIKCMVLFVTHYPKIADIKVKFPGSVEAYHASYLTSRNDESTIKAKSDHDVTYLYKLVPGVSARSFGFKVAQLAQLPSSCINKAIFMATRLETIESSRVGKKSGERRRQETPSSDQELETQENMVKSTADFHSGRTEDPEEFVSAFRGLLSKLKSATTGDDQAKSFRQLKEARGIAEDLINRPGYSQGETMDTIWGRTAT
ncbi:homolog of DNA mismatch repair protein MSH3 [Hibiscus trionum]|uniref:DNA mismatch repair protein n=1 Tax=Hibiscus trionum TaxID=183268 RepID=A0A9W7J139_HIBTR|nr:homolog of DNA mismatch repair protein MSH3 [Hibiscus trionum]